MRRLSFERRRDRGAVAVFVAITMVALLGFTALGVDMGALWSDRKQLQNGADAGALAIAQACAGGNCGDYASAATQYAVANKFDSHASGVVTNLDTGAGTVTVRDSSTRSLWFARVLGIDTADVSASATATWGPMSSGAFLPLVFSLCAFYAQAGKIVGDPPPQNTYMILDLKSKGDPSAAISSDPTGLCASLISQDSSGAHNEVAGGFGWLVPNATNGSCMTSVSVDTWVPSKTGLSEPCSFGNLLGQDVMIPIFDDCLRDKNNQCVGGNGAEYHIYSIASFKITNYCFGHGDSGSIDPNPPNCTGDNRSIGGLFQKFVSPDSTSGSGGTYTGVSQVSLTQ